MARHRRSKPPAVPQTALEQLLEKHLDDIRMKNYSEYTIRSRRIHIGFFLRWSAERGITEPVEVTRTGAGSLSAPRLPLPQEDGEPLAFTGQQDRLVPLRVWFKWMARHHHILHNPASELEMPRLGFRLPKAVLTAAEAEQGRPQPVRQPLSPQSNSGDFDRNSCSLFPLEPPRSWHYHLSR